jgi:hypothetical protein
MVKRKKQRRKDKENLNKAENTSDKVNINSQQNNLIEQIKNCVADLYYISETDAEIFPFIGEQSKLVSNEVILSQTKNKFETPVEEKDFTDFFARLIEFQDWYGDEEKMNTEKYILLKRLLEENLKDLKVFKIGKIQLDIYVVGLDLENRLLGIKTKAVET